MARNAKAFSYQKGKDVFLLARFILSIAYLVFFILSHLAQDLGDFLHEGSLNIFFIRFLYAFVFLSAYYIVSLPLEGAESFYYEKKFGLLRQNLAAWMVDYVKNYILSVLLFVVLVEVIYFFLARSELWWLEAWSFWVVLMFILTKLAPYVLIPLFYPLRPWEEGEFKRELLALASQAGVRLKDIYKVIFSQKTTKLNAFVAGWGKGRYLALADSLCQELTPEEIKSVFAHELGHIKYGHAWKIFLASAAVSFCVFFLTAYAFRYSCLHLALTPSHITTLPLLVLNGAFFFIISLPLRNALLRYWESEADNYSMKLYPEAQKFISALEKLGKRNLVTFSMPQWKKVLFATHPPLAERIRKIYRYVASQN